MAETMKKIRKIDDPEYFKKYQRREDQKEKKKTYYQQNREKILTRQKAYYQRKKREAKLGSVEVITQRMEKLEAKLEQCRNELNKFEN